MPGFFDLAAELRLQIYSGVLDDATAPGFHKCNHYRYAKVLLKPRFEDYLNLLCTNSRVRSELGAAFEKDYLPNMLWSFDYVSDLLRFVKQMRNSHFHTQDIRFELRVDVTTTNSGAPPRYSASRFMLGGFVRQCIVGDSCVHVSPDMIFDPALDTDRSLSGVAKHTCEHGVDFEARRHPEHPSLKSFAIRMPPSYMGGVIRAGLIEFVGPLGVGPSRTSTWLEGSVDCVNVDMFAWAEAEEEEGFVRDGLGFEDDDVRRVCDLMDGRNLAAASSSGGFDEDVLDGIAGLFSSDD